MSPESAPPEQLAAERAVLVRRLQGELGELTTNVTQRMDDVLPWFTALSARDRSSVSALAHLGVRTFVDWFEHGVDSATIMDRIFTSAPRELADTLSLEQTVELVRTTIAVVEESIANIAGDNSLRQATLRESLLRYSSEVAFAAANSYAQFAETRGAWDARLQAQVLDAILRGTQDHTLETRANAAGWKLDNGIFVLIGPAPSNRVAAEVHVAQIQRTAKATGLDALVGVQSDLLVAIIGGVPEGMSVEQAAKRFIGHFGAGAVVVGPLVDGLLQAHSSAQAALSGFRALPLAGTSSRLVTHEQLIAARVLNGDVSALTDVSAAIATRLRDDTRQTLGTFLERATSIESCARLDFVHVNTVRYRLRQVEEVTGMDPFDPQDALVLTLGLMQARKNTSL